MRSEGLGHLLKITQQVGSGTRIRGSRLSITENSTRITMICFTRAL